LLVCLALVVAVANAQFGFGPSIFGTPSPTNSGSVVRVVTCSGGGGSSLSLTSVNAGFTGADTLTVVMTTSPVPSVQFSWSTASFTGASALDVTVAFPDLIEFEPGVNAGYSASSNGTSINVAWTISTDNCQSSSATSYFATFSGNNDSFVINCTLPTKATTISGVNIVPTSVKCDLIVNNYNYNSTTSKLALKSQLLYQSVAVGIGAATDCTFGLCVSASNGGVHGFLDWVKTADISAGVTLNVVANVSTSSTNSNLFSGFIGTDVYFTFDSHVPSFIWDPNFGVTDQSTAPVAPPTNTSAASVATACFALALVAILAVLFH